MSAPHCCQAKKKKHSGLARDRSTVRQAKRNGREWSIRQGRFPPTARLFRRVITLQISLPPRRVRTDCSIHQIAQPWALEALPPSLDSGIPEIDVDQRLHDQSIVAQPGPSPPGNPPGNAVRPAGRSQQAARDFPLGGSAPFLPSVCHDIRGRANMPAAGWVTESSAGWHAAGVLCPWVVVVCSSPLPPCA